MIYGGVDLHRKFSVLTVMDSEGKEVVRQRRLPNNGEITELLQGLREPVAVAIEATSSWYWLYDLWEKTGHKEAWRNAIRDYKA